MLTSVALAPKRALSFILSEYLAPLGNGEKMLLLATLLTSLTSAAGVYARLSEAYGREIGIAGALAIELMYLGAALSSTSARHQSRQQQVVIWLLLLLGTLLAMTFNYANLLKHYGTPDVFVVVEALGFPLLGLASTFAAHGSAKERMEVQAVREQRRLALQAEREQAEQAMELEDIRERARIARENVQKDAELERWRAAQQAKAQLRESVTPLSHERHRDTDSPASHERHSASPRSREALYQAAVTAYRDDPQFNRTALAESLGWSRTMVNKVLDEARAKGEIV